MNEITIDIAGGSARAESGGGTVLVPLDPVVAQIGVPGLPGPPGTGGGASSLDDLTDVEAPHGAAGFALIRQTGNIWRPGVPQLRLGGLTDVDAPSDTPVGKVLGTTGTGSWGPVDPFWTGTQAEYEAIAVKDPNVLYCVAG